MRKNNRYILVRVDRPRGQESQRKFFGYYIWLLHRSSTAHIVRKALLTEAAFQGMSIHVISKTKKMTLEPRIYHFGVTRGTVIEGKIVHAYVAIISN